MKTLPPTQRAMKVKKFVAFFLWKCSFTEIERSLPWWPYIGRPFFLQRTRMRIVYTRVGTPLWTKIRSLHFYPAILEAKMFAQRPSIPTPRSSITTPRSSIPTPITAFHMFTMWSSLRDCRKLSSPCILALQRSLQGWRGLARVVCLPGYPLPRDISWTIVPLYGWNKRMCLCWLVVMLLTVCSFLLA